MKCKVYVTDIDKHIDAEVLKANVHSSWLRLPNGDTIKRNSKKHKTPQDFFIHKLKIKPRFEEKTDETNSVINTENA